MSAWYYAVNNTRNGPVSEETIKTLLSKGELDDNTNVWTEGMGNEWRPVKDVPELCFAQKPKPASEALSVSAILTQRAHGATQATENATQPSPKRKAIGLLLKTAVIAGLAGLAFYLYAHNMGLWLALIGAVLSVVGALMRHKDAPAWHWGSPGDLIEGATRQGKIVAALGVMLFVAGWYNIKHEHGGPRPARSRAELECYENQYFIGYFMDQNLAREKGLQPGATLTPSQVAELWEFVKKAKPGMHCPSGGNYQVGKVGEPVQCSVHGHLEP